MYQASICTIWNLNMKAMYVIRADDCQYSYYYIRQFETFSCLKLIHGPQQQGLMFGLPYLNHLDMSS